MRPVWVITYHAPWDGETVARHRATATHRGSAPEKRETLGDTGPRS